MVATTDSLQYNGEAGVDIALKILLEEFRHTMKFMGYFESQYI